MVGLLVAAPPAHADIIRGVMKVIAGVIELPRETLIGTFSGPPILGTAFGLLSGAINGVGLVASGALDLALSGISIAKMVAPYVLPFVF